MKLVIALNKYFGKKEGQTLEDFAKEIRALTHKDKQELADMLTPIIGEPVIVE